MHGARCAEGRKKPDVFAVRKMVFWGILALYCRRERGFCRLLAPREFELFTYPSIANGKGVGASGNKARHRPEMNSRKAGASENNGNVKSLDEIAQKGSLENAGFMVTLDGGARTAQALGSGEISLWGQFFGLDSFAAGNRLVHCTARPAGVW